MIRRLGLCLGLFWLVLQGTEAQIPRYTAPKPQIHQDECRVLRPAKALSRVQADDLRSFPSYPSRETDRDLIYKSDYIYVFRLAMAISAESYRMDFSSQKSRVHQFWNEMETYLNKVYVRDCGIRFEVVRDDKLILSVDPAGDLSGTSLINEAIGNKAYDIGILIKQKRFGGLAMLGGLLDESSKAAAYAGGHPETIAHELGHLLGADHTHGGNTGIDGEYVEPGRGQSMMSYSQRPRTFFALSSIRSIRSTLRNMGYYTDSSRQGKSSEHILPHAPYVVPLTAPKPELEHSGIRSEYVVTRGTRFQFRIPTQVSGSKWLYYAHGYDPIKGTDKTHTNVLQPAYPASEQGAVMFHPRYDFPVGGMKDVDERVLPYSNSYRNGVYSFILSAFNGEGYHDTRLVKLRIVDGEEFKITKFSGPSTTTDEAIAGQSTLSLQWQPCHSLYGATSKVRISLSADFGETFPYLLADNEPNDGSWQGVCPYVEIGKVSRSFFDNKIRGAVLKIEVIGEAAYALTHEKHYWVSGSSIIPTGGFLIKKPSEGVQFTPALPITQHYNSRAEVPAMPTLTATSRGATQAIVGEETQQGNSLIRRWRTTLGGKTTTYTQLITWRGSEDSAGEVLRAKLEGLRSKAHELYSHLGALAYPRRDAPLAIDFAKAYEAVFTAEGTIRPEATESGYQSLKEAFEAMALLPDSDITLPVSGAKYKIANFQSVFGQEYLYYLKGEGGNSATTSTNIDEATVWDCVVENGLYSFISGGHHININGFNRSDTHIALLRGYTWGAYSMLGSWEEPNQPRIAYYLPGGKSPHFTAIEDRSRIQDYKNNQVGYSSTDFRLVLVGDLPTPPPPTPTPKYYRVSLRQSEGGVLSINHNDLQRVAEGTRLSVTIDLKEGYELQSLHAGDEDISQTKQFVVHRDTEVTAVFRLKTFGLTIVRSEGGEIVVKGNYNLQAIPYGTELELEARPAEGYRLKRLYSGTLDLTSSLRLRVLASHTLQAEWERLPETPKYYKVSLLQSEGGVLSINHNDLQRVADGTRLSVTIDLKEGYELQSLHAGDEDISQTKQFVVHRDTEVTAVFRLKTFGLTIVRSEGGEIVVKGNYNLQAIPYGTELELEARPAEGYRLKRLYSGTLDLTSSLRLRVLAPHTLQAEWERLPEPPKPPTPGQVPPQPKPQDPHSTEGGELAVYPNPTSGLLHLRGFRIGIKYQVISLSGVLCFEGEVRAEEQTISLEALPKGAYVLVFEDRRSFKVLRL